MSDTLTDPTLLALHGLAIKKAGAPADVARVAGLAEDETTAALDAAVADGWARGARGKYMLTPAGRSWLDEQYPQACGALRAEPRAMEAYDVFEAVNRDLKDLMTRWQTMRVAGEEVANDHSDPDYDAAILAELGELHERVAPVLATFAELQVRLGFYPDLLAAALDRAGRGEPDYVSGVRVPSYHTVWFELHEDLIRLLARTREE